MSNYNKDSLLWKAFKRGDKKALDVIFTRHYPSLYSYGLKLTNRSELTEDCLQDFFLYLYEHRHNLKDLDKIKPYLFKAFRNRLFHYLKLNTNLVALEGSNIDQLYIQFSVEDLLIEVENVNQQRAQVTQLLNKLTNRQKELIYLKYYNDLSISDISEVIGISYQGVLNGLSKTLKKLRTILPIPH